MNPETLLQAKNIFQSIKGYSKNTKSKIVVCPPYIYIKDLIELSKKTKKIVVGAQDVFFEGDGPFTGEVSAPMLKSVGAKYVIVGHSERRALGETSSDVSRKVRAALSFDISPILCIGESARDEDGEYLKDLREMLKLSLLNIGEKNISKLIIAYEPIWTIGDGHFAMTPHDIHQTAVFIKKELTTIFGEKIGRKIPILYGGSVDPKNAETIVKESHVNGLLVGRESLKAENFGLIIKSVK